MKEANNERKYVAVEEGLLNKMLTVIQNLPWNVVSGLMEEVKKEGNIKVIEEIKKLENN